MAQNKEELAPGKLNKIKEEELVTMLQRQEKAALEYLYDHYSAALNGIILRIVISDEVAREVLQDAFMKIWNNIHSYDPAKGKLFT